MSASVNLLPADCELITRRAARTRYWISGLSLSALVLVLFAVSSWLERGELGRLHSNLAALEASCTDCERELTLALQHEVTLIGQARLLTALRQHEPLPQQLQRLAVESPDNVLLTNLVIERLPPPAPAPKKPAASSGESKAPAPKPVLPPEQTAPLAVTMHGYALEHGEITALVAAMRSMPGWNDVELKRVSREVVDGGSVLAFRLLGRWQEVQR